jgi:hypothetical protein
MVVRLDEGAQQHSIHRHQYEHIVVVEVSYIH